MRSRAYKVFNVSRLKYLLALHNIPIPLEIFPLTYFACSPHFKESSIMIPKNFVDFTCAICCPLIINDCVRLASFRCLRNNTKWVLSVFKVSLNNITHDDVIKWKQFPRNWPFVRGIHRSPVNSPHKGQ